MTSLIRILSIDVVNGTLISFSLYMASLLHSAFIVAIIHFPVRCRQQRPLPWDVLFLQQIPLRVIALQGQVKRGLTPSCKSNSTGGSAPSTKCGITIDIEYDYSSVWMWHGPLNDRNPKSFPHLNQYRLQYGWRDVHQEVVKSCGNCTLCAWDLL